MLEALARSGRALRTPAAIAADLHLGRGAAKAVRAALRKLEAEQRIERVRGRYRVRREGVALEGGFEASGRGHGGFVTDETGGRWRIADAGHARSGDRVAIQPFGDPEDRRADVLHVQGGARERWLGILQRRGRMVAIAPYRDDAEWLLRVAAPDAGDAEDGEVVVAEPVARRGGRHRADAAQTPWVRVVERLGRPGDGAADTAAVVWRHRLPEAFPPEVEAEAAEAAAQPVSRALGGRRDLRDRAFVTIDPQTARDHDDAVEIAAHGGEGFRLSVGIADVAHYVREGGVVDREALLRGNSTYFPERVVPMLPEVLASGACSLRPDEDRLALVAELDFDAHGALRDWRFAEAVIRSRERLSYEIAAQRMQDGATGPQAGMLQRLAAWARLRIALRERRGALDLDLRAPRLVLDEAGRTCDVRREERTLAHRAIEEAMLAANEAVARTLLRADRPAVFRNHEPPAPEDERQLAALLVGFGLLARPQPLDVGTLSAALARADAELARVVHPLALRAMRQARYGAECRGHFALALDSYLHFTSPIRRYPDLWVHRALKAWLAGAAPANTPLEAQRVAARCSYRERLSERAERERVDLGRCAFLRAHVGEEHEGSITGVSRFGLFVTLDAWPVDGLVHVSSLPEYVSLDERALALVAEGTRQRYVLGDRVNVRIRAVDVVRARVDLEIRRTLAPSPLRASPPQGDRGPRTCR